MENRAIIEENFLADEHKKKMEVIELEKAAAEMYKKNLEDKVKHDEEIRKREMERAEFEKEKSRYEMEMAKFQYEKMTGRRI